MNTERKTINQMEPWIGEEEKKAMAEYLESGGWLTEFQKTREFEGMIASYVGSAYASVVPNGTVSLLVALLAIGLERLDEVIVPDYTMIASANAVILAGGTPVLVDIDSRHLCLDLEGTRRAIGPKTKAIMLVTINGRYPDMEKFRELAKERNLLLLEDAAQSLGSRCQGKHLGTFGDIGSFSFSSPKIITTGQGGALVTDDEKLYQKILNIKDFGRTKGGVDEHQTLGYNFKFTDLQAVIGIEQMKKLPWRVERKKEMFKLYQDFLKDVKAVTFVETNLQDTAPWFIDVLVEQREKLSEFLKEKGVGTRPFYPAIHTQSPYAWVQGRFPVSEEVSRKGLWLPSSSFLTDEDIASVCQAIREFFQR
mgnify:FL=1